MAAYTTSTNVATILGTSFSSSTDPTDTEVVSIISRQQAFIDSYTGRVWTSATTTELLDTFDETRLSYSGGFASPQDVQTTFFLSNRPVISIDGLWENTGGLSSENWVSRSTGYANDALFYGKGGYIQFHNSAPYSGRKNVRVTYTYGESTTPNDIKLACELLSAAEVLNMIKRASDQEGLQSVSVGDASYNFGDLTRQEKGYRERAMMILDSKGYAVKADWR